LLDLRSKNSKKKAMNLGGMAAYRKAAANGTAAGKRNCRPRRHNKKKKTRLFHARQEFAPRCSTFFALVF